MEFAWLEDFLALVDFGNFSRAANWNPRRRISVMIRVCRVLRYRRLSREADLRDQAKAMERSYSFS